MPKHIEHEYLGVAGGDGLRIPPLSMEKVTRSVDTAHNATDACLLDDDKRGIVGIAFFNRYSGIGVRVTIEEIRDAVAKAGVLMTNDVQEVKLLNYALGFAFAMCQEGTEIQSVQCLRAFARTVMQMSEEKTNALMERTAAVGSALTGDPIVRLPHPSDKYSN